jgi:cytidyltransferase-like protein
MKNEKIIAVSGYFDPIHRGHVEYFKLAKNLAGNGGKLVVILNNDYQAKLKKGKAFVPLEDRKAVLEAMKYVDEVFVSVDKDMTVCESLKAIKPDVFANGGDRFSGEIPEAKICNETGIIIVDGLGEKAQSSSEIIKRADK